MKLPSRLEDVDRRYQVGPLAAYVDQFAARLSEQQYGRYSTRHKLRMVADLSLWLQRRRLDASSLNEGTIAQFLHRRRDPARAGDASAASLMLDLLRGLGIAAQRPRGSTSAARPIEQSFERYLMEERRLSQASLLNALPYVRRFLTDRFGSGPVMPDQLQPSDVTRFVLRSIGGMSPGRVKLLTGALRSFFRFLLMRGEIVANLAGAVPTVADWRLSSVPKGIDPGEVRRVLQSCDRRTITGRRDYAVLLLLARLGLRAGEVASLNLEDIDWEAGEITVRGKGPRRDRLPLPPDVGEALAAYLCRRQRCATRRVFVTVRAPVRDLSHQGSVGCIVDRRPQTLPSLARKRISPHVLRHSMAMDLLRHGAGLRSQTALTRRSSHFYMECEPNRRRSSA